MAGNDTSEEKALPASAKKLRDLRKKGNISKSTDMVTAISISVGFIYLLSTGSNLVNAFKDAFKSQDIFNSDFDISRASVTLISTIAQSVAPFFFVLVILVIGSTLLANIVLNKGFIFTIDKIKFDLNKLNVMEGLKRLFAIKNLIDLSKTLVKLTIFIVSITLIFRLNLRAPFLVTACGFQCFGPTLYYFLVTIILISIVVFMMFGFMDIFLQQWLFLRDQKMTKTEAKKEQKDQEGSPETKSARRRVRNQLLQRASSQTQGAPTIIIEGDKIVAGMRFVRFETQLPILVSKGAGAQGSDIIAEAAGDKIPIYYNNELATQLAQRLEVGSPLPEDLFAAFIDGLKATKQI